MSSQLRIPATPPIIHPVRIGLPELQRPLWSVMIPVYNCKSYLRETLESVLNQDPGSEEMQIEVCDDASSDGNVEQLVQEIGKGRVTYFRQPENVGHIRNFETCINHSNGKLIHLLHGDDIVYPLFYERMKEFFEKYNEAGAAFCRYIIKDEYDQSTWTSDQQLEDQGILKDWLRRLACEQLIVTPSMVVKREVYEALGGFYGVYYCEDWEMWLRIAANYKTGYIPEVLAEYRERAGSNSSACFVSGKDLQDIKWLINNNKKYFSGPEAREIQRIAKKKYAHYGLTTAGKLWERHHNKRGVRNQLIGSLSLSVNRDILIPATKLYLKTLLKSSYS